MTDAAGRHPQARKARRRAARADEAPDQTARRGPNARPTTASEPTPASEPTTASEPAPASEPARTSEPAAGSAASTPSRRRARPPRGSARGTLAAGAARASGERQRRAGTPLLGPSDPVEVSPARRAAAGLAAAATPEMSRRPRPGRAPDRNRRLRPVPTVVEPASTDSSPQSVRQPRRLEAAERSTDVRPGPAELVDLAVNVLRSAASAAGLPTEEAERRVAEALAYVRRRLSGDYTVDEFGFDEDYTVNVHLPLLRPLYRAWFRVEVRGIENIPSEGGGLVVANHSGTVAMDSLMTQLAVHDEHPQHRHLRMLGADLVFRMPFVGAMARRSGTTLAATSDAERLLRKGALVGVWPEGFKGVGKPFSERYKLQRFGRGGFVSAAVRTGVPIIPCSIVGAEEIYPIIGNMPTVARLLGVPYAPITPTFPLLGPLGLIPLPSKWLIEFGPPVQTTELGSDAADDPMLVFDLTDQVRETIQQTLYSLLMQRSSVFV